MTDQPPKPRRRWKRWTGLAIVLMIGCVVWMAGRESETIRRARSLTLGMTEAEVRAIMGEPLKVSQSVLHTARGRRVRLYVGYGTRGEQVVRDTRLALRYFQIKLGIGEPGNEAPYPVFVVFEDGKVRNVITQ
jgi:hypothetical protein